MRYEDSGKRQCYMQPMRASTGDPGLQVSERVTAGVSERMEESSCASINGFQVKRRRVGPRLADRIDIWTEGAARGAPAFIVDKLEL